MSYRYRCVDHSRLTAWISAQIAPRLEARLPAAWSANTITWLGSALMWALLLGVALCESPRREQLAPLWVALLWSYCVLDHVDGCRARRRKSSSAWGEFLDHALDAWHASIAVFAIGAMGHGVRPGVVVLTVSAVGLATVATWLEQKLRGEFTLGALGPVEAVLASGLFLALWSWPAAAAILNRPASIGWGITWGECFPLAGGAGCLLTAIHVGWRSRPVASVLGAAALAAAAVLVFAHAHAIPWWGAGLALAIFFAEYTARVIGSHLMHTPMPWPDFVGVLIFGLAAFFPNAAELLTKAALLWLAGRALFAWFRTARALAPLALAPVVPVLKTD